MDTENTKTAAMKGKGFMRWAVVVAIVIVLNLFFTYAVSLVYKAPVYDAYFPTSSVVEPITDKADCLSVGGQWTDPDPRYQTADNQPQPGTCDSSPAGTPATNMSATYNASSGEIVGPDGTKYTVKNSTTTGDDGWKEMLAPVS